MKKSVITIVIISVATIAGIILFMNRQRPELPRTVTAAAMKIPEPPARETAAEVKAPAPTLVKETLVAPAPPQIVNEVKPLAAPVKHSRAVDTLVFAQTSFDDRKALFAKIKKLGELDAAIAELKQRVAENPNDTWTATALGEALMNKFPVQDFNEVAALGLQIDQSFDAALKNEPANWEAQFNKALSMSYWPDVAGKGPEIIQRFSSLIDQQEAMPAQPQFAQAYLRLGNQYQKNGESDKATAAWQLGLQKFPNDASLQKKVNGQ